MRWGRGSGVCVVGVAVALLLGSSEAGASGGGNWLPCFDKVEHGGIFLPAGASLQVTGYGDKGARASVGAEASLVAMSFSGVWLGGYADASLDMWGGRRRVSYGPELGFCFIGIDFGREILYDESTLSGYRVRGILTIGVASLFAGGGRVSDSVNSVGYVDVGLLLKLPFPLVMNEGSGIKPFWELF